MSAWPALIDAFPYLPTETHKSKRGYVREKIASYSGIIPWPKGWRHHDKCEIKIYGFWSDPETGLTHITLMSNVGYDCYRRMNPHNSMKTPFCGVRGKIPRCQYVYKGRPNCPTCIRTFEKSMESYERYLTRFTVDTGPGRS